MKPEEEIICNYIHNFVNENWDKIDKKKMHILQTKTEFLKEVKGYVGTALWVLYEVCRFGMDKDYSKELFVEGEYNGYRVLKVNEQYIKIIHHDYPYQHEISFCEPKFKQVMYFE